MVSGKNFYKPLLFLLATLFLVKPVFASVTDGTISSGDAWSTKIGWLNFAATHGNVHVTDAGLTGYVWNTNYGWIKLNPSNSGVKNTTAGVLSGSAWGENIGWIDFSGVTIGTDGKFTGTASGDNTGAINFDCAHCLVQTDWRPSSVRPTTGGGSSGGALPVTVSSPSPVAVVTSTPTTSPVMPSPTTSPVVSPVSPKPTSTIGQIIGKVGEIIGKTLARILPVKLVPRQVALLYSELQLWIPNWFKAPPIEKIPVERFVSKETPLAMKGKWRYIDPVPVNQFVFAPLPKEFLALTNKFPQMKSILQQVGVNRLSDIEKLKSVQMYLPGLTQAVAFNKPDLKTSQFGTEKAIPIGDLSKDLKNKIPSDVVFARSAGQLVDFKIALSLTDKNRPEQKIATVSGKPLQLTVKPDFPAKSVKGYLVFRSKTPQARIEMPLTSIIGSLFMAEPAFAYTQDQPVEVEEKLVLLSFDYTDPDGDGIYTADIQSPVPAGEYEIITVINYVDPDLGSKQIRLITVVDPEGYVFENVGGKELRIPDAVVTLYHFNTESKTYELWPAKDFQQDNPQHTDVRGSYSFLVPGGKYYIKVEAKDYLTYTGEPFFVDEGGGVHLNIELKSKYGWFKNLDWKTTALILIAMLLLYNFYKDRRRDKKQAGGSVNTNNN